MVKSSFNHASGSTSGPPHFMFKSCFNHVFGLASGHVSVVSEPCFFHVPGFMFKSCFNHASGLPSGGRGFVVNAQLESFFKMVRQQRIPQYHSILNATVHRSGYGRLKTYGTTRISRHTHQEARLLMRLGNAPS